MRLEKLKTGIILIVTLCAAVAFFYLLATSLYGSPASDADIYPGVVRIASHDPRGFGLPKRLVIPAINVDAKVQQVGLTQSGAMGIPTNFTDVAWYKNGTIPGEMGSAVIDGHVDNALGLKGVFKYLKDVKVGDDVYITDENGKQIHFVVRNVTSYPYNAAPTEEIFNESNKTLLRLITCGGTWIQSAKTYDERVVVTAEYVPTP